MNYFLFIVWCIETVFIAVQWSYGMSIHPVVSLGMSLIITLVYAEKIFAKSRKGTKNERVAYVCDGRWCENGCTSGTDCHHTFDIKHAKNFMRVGDGMWMENEKED